MLCVTLLSAVVVAKYHVTAERPTSSWCLEAMSICRTILAYKKHSTVRPLSNLARSRTFISYFDHLHQPSGHVTGADMPREANHR